MKKRYSEEQIVRILGEVAGGQSIAETCRKYGVSEATVHRWRERYGAMSVGDVKQMRQLAAENSRLRKIVSQQAMDIDALKELLGKKW